MQTWTHDGDTQVVRKDDFPPGPHPWDDEPDKAQWVDEKTDLDCLIVRNHGGALCGYVGLPPGHPSHGVPYQKLEDTIDVHGGLTFSGSCQENAPEGHGICHIPEPGRPDDVWWLGFDTAHAFDLRPQELHMAATITNWPTKPPMLEAEETYRTFEYVKSECENLARQLAAVQ